MSIFCNPALELHRTYTSAGHFKANQNKTLQNGYRILLGTIKEDEGRFPEEGQYQVQYKVSEVKAKRPSLFTKMSLTSMTKRVNWGTSATRDATIEDLLQKESLVYDKKYLRINPKLKTTIELLLNKGLIDFEMTSNWQMALDKLDSYEQAVKFIATTREDTKKVHETFAQLLK